jgi:carbamoyl-phosphate synthase large subunit
MEALRTYEWDVTSLQEHAAVLQAGLAEQNSLAEQHA